MSMLFAFLLGLFAVAHAVELTPANYDDLTFGKSVFINFHGPECGHCQKMRPAWDALVEAFADSETSLIAEVDCTHDGKVLCDGFGVQGYPTLKWGDWISKSAKFQGYHGARDFESLEAFARENLKPVCGFKNLELCDDATFTALKTYMVWYEGDPEDFDRAMEEEENKMKAVESWFDAEVSKMQDEFDELYFHNEAKLAAVRAAGSIELMLAVRDEL